jgi:hypothetical protein
MRGGRVLTPSLFPDILNMSSMTNPGLQAGVVSDAEAGGELIVAPGLKVRICPWWVLDPRPEGEERCSEGDGPPA